MEKLNHSENLSEEESLERISVLNKLVVGTKEYPIQQVFEILTNSPSAPDVYQRLRDIAFNLYNSSETINEIYRRLSSDSSFSSSDALYQILENWVENRGTEATMLELYSVLRRHGIPGAGDDLWRME